MAADETPLHYVPHCKGTYVFGADPSCFVAGECDKRQVTATPCTSRSGEIVCLQIIWRGISKRFGTSMVFHIALPVCFNRCLPATNEDDIAVHIYNDFAPKKCQTMATWTALLKRLCRWAHTMYASHFCLLASPSRHPRKENKGWPMGLPLILVCDNVSSHLLHHSEKVGPSARLMRIRDLGDDEIYVYLGIAGFGSWWGH